ncbi:MAG: DNA recombination protein RmuC [Verrucomicrobiales bacterium]
MQHLVPVLTLLLGIALGGAAAWYFLKSKWAAAAHLAGKEGDVKEAVLQERLASRESQLVILRTQNEQHGAEMLRLRTELSREIEERSAAQQQNEEIPKLEAEIASLKQLRERLQNDCQNQTSLRAAAEEKCQRLPALEKIINEREGAIGELQALQNTHLARISELETKLDEERKASAEKLAVVEQARTHLSDAFKALSSEALKSNNQAFLDLAKITLEKFQESARGDLDKREKAITELVKPVRDSLDKVDLKINDLEKARTGAYEKLNQQVQSLLDTEKELRGETAKLVQALHAPAIRGRWGEMQLKRVVEMAGMLDHCDFYEQRSITTDDGRLRPDLLVKLPNSKNIVIDAKAPLEAFLAALECSDEATRKSKLRDHAQQIRAHVLKLSQKSYWDAFKPAPEFVVLFLPGESFFSAALEHEPALIEMGVDQKVILATPTTLIALLRAVAYGWQQQNLAQNAQNIADLGRELYKRLADMSGHFARVGKNLGQAVESYNGAVGSLENRVLSTARKFKELQAAPSSVEMNELPTIDQVPRVLQAGEMLSRPAATEKELAQLLLGGSERMNG